jgi:arabinogalactan endo-1,4-beta-galactosidase
MIGILALLIFQSLELFAAPAGSAPYIVGADVSWVQEQEDRGIRFSANGTNADFFAILRDHGFNAVRLRLFHAPTNPGGYSAKGYCDLPHTIAMARRAKQAGLRVLLDFHYSDTWADPSHQHRPLAWRELEGDALAAAVGDYTRDTLAAFRAAGVVPEFVQPGNEITNGMLWRDGNKPGPLDWDAFAAQLRAAVSAIRANDRRTRVLLHVDCGGNNDRCRWFFDEAIKRGVSFDVIGLSYYPKWHGPIDGLRSNVVDLAARYTQTVSIVEYSAPTLREPDEILRALPPGRALGSFIWEPTAWPTRENPALFDKNGAAKPALEQLR